MKLVDLSLPIDDAAYEVHKVAIDRTSHQAGIRKLNWVMMQRTLLGKIRFLLGKRIIPAEYFHDGEFLSLEMVTAAVHCGTHVDYTYHYGTTSEGKPSQYINDLPLDRCYAPAVVLDFTGKKAGEIITAADTAAAFKRIAYTVKAGDIVLFRTGRDSLYGSKDYFFNYPGIDISTIDFLLDKGVTLFGTDTMGIDLPYPFMMKKFLSTKDPSVLWPSHFYGRTRSFSHIERLAHLDTVPVSGFYLSCFPVKISKVGAAWCRAVAFLNE